MSGVFEYVFKVLVGMVVVATSVVWLPVGLFLAIFADIGDWALDLLND